MATELQQATTTIRGGCHGRVWPSGGCGENLTARGSNRRSLKTPKQPVFSMCGGIGF